MGPLMMPTCREVSRMVASDELASAGWRRRLAFRLHWLMCRHCRRYSRQIEAIGTAARQVLGVAEAHSGSRERLRSSILDKLAPGDGDGPDPSV